jgi:hypothetical protein
MENKNEQEIFEKYIISNAREAEYQKDGTVYLGINGDYIKDALHKAKEVFYKEGYEAGMENFAGIIIKYLDSDKAKKGLYEKIYPDLERVVREGEAQTAQAIFDELDRIRTETYDTNRMVDWDRTLKRIIKELKHKYLKGNLLEKDSSKLDEFRYCKHGNRHIGDHTCDGCWT